MINSRMARLKPTSDTIEFAFLFYWLVFRTLEPLLQDTSAIRFGSRIDMTAAHGQDVV
jgi:hypothetical protein